MRKFVLLLIMGFITMVGFSQSQFDKFQEEDDVTVVTVTTGAFKLLSSIEVNDPEEQEVLDLLSGINSLKVIVSENAKLKDAIKREVEGYLKSESLTELMKVKEKDSKVNIYTKPGKSDTRVSEVFMFVEELKESVVVIIEGDIDLQKIAKLTQELNVPHADKIKE